jgi:hypothetical protein
MSKTKLIINNNGSIKIEGDFEIMDSSGMVYGLEGRTALGLCRCGLSAVFTMVHRSTEHESKAFDLPPMKTNRQCFSVLSRPK